MGIASLGHTEPVAFVVDPHNAAQQCRMHHWQPVQSARILGPTGAASMIVNDAAPREEGRLTTHVLDTETGCPAAGLKLELYRLFEGATPKWLAGWTTNSYGRTDLPLLVGSEVERGEYELVFDVAGWRSRAGFYDHIPIRFRINDPLRHYHVPLILAPFGYSTYRGS